MKHVVYYFSGTGNSMSVAKKLEAKGATVYAITDKLLKQNELICDADKIGFIFPLYYLGLPKIVHEFIDRLTVKNPSYIYMICTMGWNLKGGAIKQMKTHLAKKNCSLNMGCYLQMPMNDFTLANVCSKEKQGALLEKATIKLDKILDMVQQSKIYFDREPIKFMVEKRNMPFINSTNGNDKFYAISDDCTGCGLCKRVCPVSNIEMAGGRPLWQHHCESCMACFHYCPKLAISYKNKGKEITRYHHPDVSVQVSESYRNSKSI
jgi:MinD superfamily P-loop ATPase containing an inserted ferredoxin domain